jgi:tetratricopeptide (TPR) repeat protein
MFGFAGVRFDKTQAVSCWLSILFVALPGVSAAQPRRLTINNSANKHRRALVMANAGYSGPNALKNPVHDAEDLKTALQRFHFAVTIATDLGLGSMRKSIDSFLKEIQTGDVVLFYFAGHGMQIDGENLLVPVDFHGAPENAAKAVCVRFDDVQSSFEKSPASLSILLMDACRDNPYRGTRSWARGLAPTEAGLASYVVYAASPGNFAEDNPAERNGLFMKYLLESIRQPPPLSQLFRNVRESVYNASNRRQRPYLTDQVIGDFWFEEKPQTAPLAPAAKQSQDLLEEATRLYNAGNCHDAMERFDRAVKVDPQNPLAQNAAGLASHCNGLDSVALERFNMAIQLKPDLAAAYLNRGMVYYTIGKFDLAVEDLTWAIDQEPSNAVFYVRRGRAYFAQRAYEEAVADFDRAIELNPADAEAFHGRGMVHQRLHEYSAAVEDYQAALERKHDFPEARQDLAFVQQRLKQR